MIPIGGQDRDNFVRNLVTVRGGGGSYRPVVRKIAAYGLSVDVAEIMADLQIDDDFAQPTVERMANAAAGFIERRTAYVMRPGQYEMLLHGWPGGQPWLEIDRGPFREIVSLEYLTAKETWAAVDAANYWAQDKGRSFTLSLLSTFSLPTIWSEAQQDGIRLRFEAGFDAVTDSAATGMDLVPDAELVTALTMVTGHYYKHRELFEADKMADLELGAGSLLGSLRQFW